MGYNVFEKTEDLIEARIRKITKSIEKDEKYLQDIEDIKNPASSPSARVIHPVLQGFVKQKIRFSQKEIDDEILEDESKKINAYLTKIGKTKKDVAEKKLTKKQQAKLAKIKGEATHKFDEAKTDELGKTLWKSKPAEISLFILGLAAIAFACILWELVSFQFNGWRMIFRTIVFSIGSFNLYRLIRYWRSDLDVTNRSGFWHLANIAPFVISIVYFISGNITAGAIWFLCGFALCVALGYWKIKVGIILISILMFTVIIWDANVITQMINQYDKTSIQGQGPQWIMLARWLSAYLLGIFAIIVNLKFILLPLGTFYLFYQLLTLDEMFDRNLLRRY